MKNSIVINDFYFDQGIDHTVEIIDFALERNIIEKRGAWYYYHNEKIGQGRNATKEFLLNNPDLYESIKNEALNFSNLIKEENDIKEKVKEEVVDNKN